VGWYRSCFVHGAIVSGVLAVYFPLISRQWAAVCGQCCKDRLIGTYCGGRLGNADAGCYRWIDGNGIGGGLTTRVIGRHGRVHTGGGRFIARIRGNGGRRGYRGSAIVPDDLGEGTGGANA
jgi:hypothetical protein